MQKDRIDALYGGWMGKCIGVIHGANIEGWTSAQIERVFGDIDGYPFSFRNFCSDDDLNGPVFLQRAILDYGAAPTMEQLGDTLLNYVSDGHGFFWWGGYGISTEDTAYHNLEAGLVPPLSGSARINGTGVANQIGGQIFSDCWGLCCLGNPQRAAQLARRMASVTHDQEGLNGAGFVAAAIAAAYEAESMDEVLDAALSQVPEDSAYKKMALDVRAYAENHRDSWKACYAYVKERYDYRFYPGACHIIPNAAVMVLSLVCGGGDFRETIRTAAMCGWDTDCNEGNLGAILGTFAGMEGIPRAWLGQVGDLLICSGSLAGRNIQTVPQAAENTLRVSEILGEWQADDLWESILRRPEGQYMHFQFPFSTHALRARPEGKGRVVLENIACQNAYIGKRGLKAAVRCFGNTDSFELYWKSYYRPEDFEDNRYQPDLAPVIYPGDALRFHYRFDQMEAGKRIRVIWWYLDRISGQRVTLRQENIQIADDAWQEGRIRLPSGRNIVVEEVGCTVMGQEVTERGEPAPFVVYIGDVELSAHPDYGMDRDGMMDEIWTNTDTNPVGFSYLRGAVTARDGRIELSGCGKPAEMYTGSCNWTDIEVGAELVPLYGNYHYLLGRVQGCLRWYAAGLIREGGQTYAALLKKDKEITVLKKTRYDWLEGEPCRLSLRLKGSRVTVLTDGRELLYADIRTDYNNSGCIGIGNERASRTACLSYSVREI